MAWESDLTVKKTQDQMAELGNSTKNLRKHAYQSYQKKEKERINNSYCAKPALTPKSTKLHKKRKLGSSSYTSTDVNNIQQ